MGHGKNAIIEQTHCTALEINSFCTYKIRLFHSKQTSWQHSFAAWIARSIYHLDCHATHRPTALRRPQQSRCMTKNLEHAAELLLMLASFIFI
jgi:hypothetical protein